MESKNNYENEIIKRLDTMIEQNNTIIEQDTYRAKHIATIKKDLRAISTIVIILTILYVFGLLIAFNG